MNTIDNQLDKDYYTIKLNKEFESFRNSTKKKIRYIIDKTIVENWGKPEGDVNAKIFFDWLYFLVAESKKAYVYVAIDVLEELKKEGKRFVDNKTFKELLCRLVEIKEVNPDIKDLSSKQATLKLCEEYVNNGYPCIILTCDKAQYNLKEIPTGGLIVSVNEIIGSMAIFYTLVPQLREVLDRWVSGNWE